MNRWLLSAVLFWGAADFAVADYVILVANVGTEKDPTAAQPGMGQPGRPGAAAMPGGRGGFQGVGNRGGGFQGVGNRGGGFQGVGNRGGGFQGVGNRGGPGRPGMGNRGGPGVPGMGNRGGFQGMGMRGMRGGMGRMMRMPGMGGMMDDDPDDVPDFIVAVVEVKTIGNDVNKQFKKSEALGAPLAKVYLTARLGDEFRNASTEKIYLTPKTSFGETHVLTDGNGKPIPTVAQQFNKKFTSLKNSADASRTDLFEAAKWTLSHGLIDKFPQVMDKLQEIDKAHPEKDKIHRAVAAYIKVKSALDKKISPHPAIARIKSALRYRDVVAPHYDILYSSSVDARELKSHQEQMENSFRGFYYWFALKGVVLAMPSHRQLALVTGTDKDFDRIQEALRGGPVVVDGFFARRENITVMSSQRRGESYDALKKYYQNWEDKGFHRATILTRLDKNLKALRSSLPLAEAQMLAIMLKALEKEAELTTVSHQASRQLLFASGQLPRNVAAPEWLLFGMGSFFETPLRAPWPSLGAPNHYYLLRWNELKGKGEEIKPGATLRRVITDSYFRQVPPEGKSGSKEQLAHDAAVRKARASAWSLIYFLATSEKATSERYLDGLQRYFKELAKMPRDIELDEDILLGCFARAFGLVDANNKPDNSKLDALAREWYSYIDNLHFDCENVVKKIRQKLRDKQQEMREAKAKAKANRAGVQVDPLTGQPLPQQGGFAPGMPGGGFPQPGQQPRRNGQFQPR